MVHEALALEQAKLWVREEKVASLAYRLPGRQAQAWALAVEVAGPDPLLSELGAP